MYYSGKWSTLLMFFACSNTYLFLVYSVKLTIFGYQTKLAEWQNHNGSIQFHFFI